MGQFFKKEKNLVRTIALEERERERETQERDREKEMEKKEKFLTYRIVRICRRCRHENDIVKRTLGMFGSHGAFEVDEVYCPWHGQSVRGDILLFRV